MSSGDAISKLRLLPIEDYTGVNADDPIRFYILPIVGRMYRRRVELCLGQCTGGRRILEVGFGSGVTFLNLADIYEEIWGLDTTADCYKISTLFQRLGAQVVLRNGSVLKMPYENNFFDTVLLISILEHLKPYEQESAFSEIRRVLKPGGQVVFGVPVERALMWFAFRCLGFNIREHHFSTHDQVFEGASHVLTKRQVTSMRAIIPLLGVVYQIGDYVKE